MLQIGRRQGGCLVGVGMWVKNSDVNKGPLKPAAPEAIHGHIETCLLSYISRSTREGGAHRGGLKVWFNLDVTAYLSEKIGCKIVYLIVTNRGKPTPGTGESMADGERSAVLYCTVLYCTVLYCTVLYCTVLYCTVLLSYLSLFFNIKSRLCDTLCDIGVSSSLDGYINY